MLAVFIVGFFACIVSMQASVSRVLWAFARDDELPASGWLKRLSGKDRMPVNAILLAGCVAAGMYLTSFTKIYATLVAFTTVGFYISFGFPVFAAARSVCRGSWRAGPFDLGRLSAPIIVSARYMDGFRDRQHRVASKSGGRLVRALGRSTHDWNDCDIRPSGSHARLSARPAQSRTLSPL